jgi:hypothetical protein
MLLLSKKRKDIIEEVGFSAQSTTFLALRFAMLWFAASGGRVTRFIGCQRCFGVATIAGSYVSRGLGDKSLGQTSASSIIWCPISTRQYRHFKASIFSRKICTKCME